MGPSRQHVRITVRAPAKLNLDLRILRRRPDGFHELRTVLQSIELHDTLSMRLRPGPLTVRSRTRGVPVDDANLIWTAARTLWGALGRAGAPEGVSISIRKVVPMAGGLGGGSSDAAAALRGLCSLWRLSPGDAWLHELASTLGADVPFFLEGGTALGVGRGDRIRRVPSGELDSLWVVLAFPRFGVSTAEAYRWFDAEQPDRHRAARAGQRSLRLSAFANDLEPAVARRHPALQTTIAKLRGSGAMLAAMTGSGSAVFGLFPRRASAFRARRALRQPGWRTVVTRTVGHEAYRRLTAVNVKSRITGTVR